MKKWIALLLAALMVISCVSALAATSIGNNAASSLSDVKPFKFEHKKNGIGRGACPVYSAPYEGAFRAANGRAVVSTNDFIDLGGYSDPFTAVLLKGTQEDWLKVPQVSIIYNLPCDLVVSSAALADNVIQKPDFHICRKDAFFHLQTRFP